MRIPSANHRDTVAVPHARAGRRRRPALPGLDDLEPADVLGVTVVRSDPGVMGERAAAPAFARLDGSASLPRHLGILAGVVVRGSGEVEP